MDNSTSNPRIQKHRWFSGISFRSRLSWSIVLLVAFAMLGTAMMVFSRANAITTFLFDQVTENVTRLTENDLKSTVDYNTEQLDDSFAPIANGISSMSRTFQAILSQETGSGTMGLFWDARTKLFQLPSGSWDNDNTEVGSVFLPVQATLSDEIVTELNILKQFDLVTPPLLFLQEHPDLVAVYFGSVQGTTLYYPNIDLASLLPADFDVTRRPWFEIAGPTQNPGRKVVWSVPYLDAASHGLVITNSAPVYDDDGRFRGVFAADMQLTRVAELVSSIRVKNTGYAFLLDGEGRLIVMPPQGYSDFGLDPKNFEGEQALTPVLDKVPLELFQVLNRMASSQKGIRRAEFNGVEKYVAYTYIPSIGYSLGLVVPVSETQAVLISNQQRLTRELNQTYVGIVILIAILLTVALFISRLLGDLLTRPIIELTNTATRLADGDLSVTVASRSRDEIGILANAFNVMTTRLRELIASLEQRVAERTADLEKTTIESITRAEELQTVSEVARAVSTETNFENLLTLVTNVVSKRFGFYHVGVFLLDEVNRNAVLRASNSPGGRRMVARGHKLSIGQGGIVGHVADTGEPRIALDVGEDATYFNNPDLPETRSEMALPLSLRGRIIGVLDVQSTQPNAFTPADVETISILADQVAIAIENARLLADSQHALAESQSLYGEYVGRTWGRKTAQSPIGYYYASGAGQLINEPVEWDEGRNALKTGRLVVTTPSQQSRKKETACAIAVPIRLQNQVIGILDIRSADPNRTWTEDEILVIEATAERLALALENARLFEETSSRAAREHAVADITSKIRNTNDPQAMIRTAIEELQRVLSASRVEIIPQVISAHLPGREHGNDEPN